MLSAVNYMRLATFRRTLRQFLRFSEMAAARVGLTGRQYQAMLAIRASASGGMTIRELAQDLLIKHNSAVELVDRLGSRNLVLRERATQDRRKVEVRLTPLGLKTLRDLASVHRQELRRVGPIISAALAEFTRPGAKQTAARERNR
ncbi:MAG TPA: MarR family transcriptional regulator [Burkholderiales bacterium]|nr:MarR family transcriptional regulator [Burkholderiales bacterium]